MSMGNVTARSGDEVHFSGVLIVCSSDSDVSALAEQVGGIAGAEVHYVYPERARIIAVLETNSIADQRRLLERIRKLPAVVVAQPAYHFVDSMETPE
jgi:nitrate reductase NapAB chaperone NapD